MENKLKQTYLWLQYITIATGVVLLLLVQPGFHYTHGLKLRGWGGMNVWTGQPQGLVIGMTFLLIRT